MAGFAGVGPSVAPVLRLRLAMNRDFQLRLTGAGLGSNPSVQTDRGKATIKQAVVLAEGTAVLGQSRWLRPFVVLGTGIYYAGITGTGIPPYQGESGRAIAFAVDGGIGLSTSITPSVDLSLEAHVVLAEPGIAVRFVDQDAARVGQPALPRNAHASGLDMSTVATALPRGSGAGRYRPCDRGLQPGADRRHRAARLGGRRDGGGRRSRLGRRGVGRVGRLRRGWDVADVSVMADVSVEAASDAISDESSYDGASSLACSSGATPVQEWTFDTTIDGWIIGVNTGVNASLTWTGSTGYPTPGALQVDFTPGPLDSGVNSAVWIHIEVPPSDLTGRTLSAWVWLDSGRARRV